ncbi:MAG: hypothetical protein J0L80_02680 [Chitinophagales bacterium]|nr:hypothetical protein [Chitinophagales bacterium]
MNEQVYSMLISRYAELQMEVGFNRNPRPQEILYHIHKRFTPSEIEMLKEGNAIPKDYDPKNYN